MYYKALSSKGRPIFGLDYEFSLPTYNPDGSWTPGAWTPTITPRLCVSGWHLTQEGGLPKWSVEGNLLFEAEYRGKVVWGRDKLAASSIRLLRMLPGSVEEEYFRALLAANIRETLNDDLITLGFEAYVTNNRELAAGLGLLRYPSDTLYFEHLLVHGAPLFPEL